MENRADQKVSRIPADTFSTVNTDDAIYFNFSYAALKLLGKNLYSNAANAISELVANGLDAKAEEIYVYIDMSDKAHSSIEILDSGSGMDYADLAEKYVWIGRNKRADSELTAAEKQSVMGRKGIGKLAALYLSNRYYILTKKDGAASENKWEVNLAAYDDSEFPKLDRINRHVELVNQAIWSRFSHGTVIKLENVDLRRNGEKKIEGLKRVFSDFYLLDALKAEIYVAVKTQANEPIKYEPVQKSIAYKNFYALFDNSGLNIASKMSKSIAFTWLSQYEHIANKLRDTVVLDANSFSTRGKKVFHKEDGTPVEKEYQLTGWIAIHSTIEQKNSPDGRFIRNAVYQPNRLRLFVRNKLAVGNYFDMRNSTQAMANYIEGEISFNILDDDDLPDIATSSRQDFLEDERIELLVSILDPIINALFKYRLEVGQKIRIENDLYHKHLLEEERQKKEAEKAAKEKAEQEAREAAEAQAKAEKEAQEAEEAKAEAERKQKDAEAVAQREIRRSQYILNVSDVEDKNIMNSVHSIYNMSNRVKENLDELNNIEGFPEAGRKKLEKASTSNQRILSVSKLISKAGRVVDNNDAVKNVDLTVFLNEYVKDVLCCIYDSNEIAIECVGDLESTFFLKIKPLSFIMMVDNIIGNAIKAHAKHLSIIIDSSNSNNYSVIFKDDGDGLANGIADPGRLFEFGVTTTNGSGLGLFYAKKLMKDLRGTISISANHDSGASVILSWKR